MTIGLKTFVNHVQLQIVLVKKTKEVFTNVGET